VKIYRPNSVEDSSQRGQTFLAIVIFVAAVVLVMLGVAVDYTQIWAHRQMAQGAADAACQAGAADLFIDGTDPTASTDFPGLDFSWIGGSGFDCSSKPNTPPCQYAALNGYTGSKVHVTFPASLSGVSAIPSGFPTVANPYIQVTVTDSVAMSFTKLVSSTKTVSVPASAACGLNAVNTPIPLVVLHTTANPSFQVNGSASVTIFGGPQRAIQVNSNSATAVSAANTDGVNLSLAGPNNDGADFAVFGGPATKPTGVDVGTGGSWLPGANPFGDPFAATPVPSKPSTAGTSKPVPFGYRGCPDPIGCVEFTPGDYTGCATGNIAPGATGCLMLPYSGSNSKFSSSGTNWQASHSYTAGTLILPQNPPCASGITSIFLATNAGTSGTTCPAQFATTARCTPQSDGTCSGGTFVGSGASPITWQNIGTATKNPSTAIFDPGLYYVGAHGFGLAGGTTARISTAAGDGSKGVLFYFSTAPSLAITSSSGSSSACTSVSAPSYNSGTPNNCVVAYNRDGGVSLAATGYVPSVTLKCPTGSNNPSQVPATISGSVLLGPCGGTNGIGATGQYGSPDGNRGFLFFQNRAVAANGGSCTGGFSGGCAILGGGGSFIFSGFIYLHNGNGASCGTNTSCLTLAGGSGGNSFTIGNVVADKVSLVGSSGVKMILNPTATFSVLRPELLQ
jgi:Putative Flp pilus-assembly TadE/G-like